LRERINLMTAHRAAGLTVLLRLRYRLLWAQARTRQGKVVIFVLGYLLALCLFGLLALGGIAAALAAVKLGRAEKVATLALTAVFLYAVIASVVLGAGVNDAFSDQALRRYPMSNRQRLVARHVATLLEPTWLFVLGIEIGLAFGFRMAVANSIALALAAAVLLVLINYLAARIVVGIGERVLATRAGTLVVMIAIGLLPIVIIAVWKPVAAAIERGPWLLRSGRALLALLPPGAAATALTTPASLAVVRSLIVLAAWGGVLALALAALERRPVRAHRTARADVRWNNWYDRVAALFGPELAPLTGKTLRYYVRSPQVRYNLPIIVFMLVQMPLTTHFQPHAVALAGMMVLGLSTGALSLNVFGFDGAGFRRYWLLPISARTILLANALVALLPGALLLPVLLVTLPVVVHSLAEPRMLALLAASGITGVFVFQGIGLWTSVLSPQAIPFYAVWGNRLSFGANSAIAGGILTFFALTWRLSRLPRETLLAHWELALPVVALAALFYALSVSVASKMLAARRERLISTIEGLG
jgi:hypothetical protein